MRRVTANKHLRKLRKDSRRIPVKGHREFGEGEDHGRYYRCWNCGFICDSERDALDGPDGRSGAEAKQCNLYAYGSWNDNRLTLGGVVEHFHTVQDSDGISEDEVMQCHDTNTGILCLGGSINHFHVAMQNGSDGEPLGIPHRYCSVVTRGCPFCGCTNYRGDF